MAALCSSASLFTPLPPRGRTPLPPRGLTPPPSSLLTLLPRASRFFSLFSSVRCILEYPSSFRFLADCLRPRTVVYATEDRTLGITEARLASYICFHWSDGYLSIRMRFEDIRTRLVEPRTAVYATSALRYLVVCLRLSLLSFFTLIAPY